jgi:DNA polymerase elongation subunit (family B)
MKLVLDIETVPCAEEARRYLPEIEPPASISSDPHRLERWHADEKPELRENQYRRTSLDASFGRVFCIGMMSLDASDDPAELVAIFGDDERTLLGEFWRKVGAWKSPYLVTHNGLQFDLPFLWRRSVINRVKPTMEFRLSRFRTDAVFDTMAVWSNWESRSGIKLETLAGLLEVGAKSMSGAGVFDLWKLGHYTEIAEYCANDVYLTYACYCRMTFSRIRPREAVGLTLEAVPSDRPLPKGRSD